LRGSKISPWAKLTGQNKKHDQCKWVRYNPNYHVSTKSFDLFCEDKNDWRLKVKGQLANPGLPGNDR